MSGYRDVRLLCLELLEFRLQTEGYMTRLKGNYAARLAVAGPSGAHGYVMCERGYGDVEWFW